MAPENMPITIPSIIKGMRTKPFVAPTDFMMFISILRENMVTFTVLEMMNRDTTPSTMTMPMLQYRTSLSRLLSLVAVSR